MFKKQLLRFGDWIDPLFPEELMSFDSVAMAEFVRNFKAGIPGRVPVPLTHTEDPDYNTGELVDLLIEGDGSSDEDGLYGVLEIHRPKTAEDIRNDTIFDVSIKFSPDYEDNETGAHHGHTVQHVALLWAISERDCRAGR